MELPGWLSPDGLTEDDLELLLHAQALRDVIGAIPEDVRFSAMRLAGICLHCLLLDRTVSVEAMPCQCWNDE